MLAVRPVVVIVSLCISLAGCASQISYADPLTIVLQDPLPGKALVYFIRAPYDPAAVSLSMNDKVFAKLPSESYTAVSVAPGSHEIQTMVLSLWGTAESAVPPITLRVEAGMRYFLVISGRAELPSPWERLLAGMLLKSPPDTPGRIVPGSREWKPYQESDARPLITIGKLVLPERE